MISPQPDALKAQAKAVQAAYRNKSADSLWTFVGGLRIQVGGKNKLFWSVASDFQKKCFKALAPNIEALREGDRPNKQRVWIERTKKASKDADLAAIVCWLVAFPKRPFLGEIGAADSDQAAIIYDRVSNLLEYNHWLLDYIELLKSPQVVRSKLKKGDGSSVAQVEILASDSTGGSHGSTPDLLIMNELTHIKNRWEFVDACFSNAAGVPDGMVVVATNAGYLGTKAHVMRENAIESKDWLTFIYDRPAPWHNQSFIDDERSKLTLSQFRRLWEGKWVSGKGDALNEDDVAKCFCLDGPTEVEDEWDYVGGIDLGISHDHSAYVILGINERRRLIKTAWWKAWKPGGANGEVNLRDVQETVRIMSKAYRVRVNFYDPTEARLMAQQLIPLGVPMREMSFSRTSNLDAMAQSLIQVVESNVLKCYDDPEGTLRRDFGKFEIEEKSYGWRLNAVRDEYGHADVGTALVIALPAAIEMMGGLTGELRPDDVLIFNDDTPLTEEEKENMDQGLREIIEEEEAWEKELDIEDSWDEVDEDMRRWL